MIATTQHTSKQNITQSYDFVECHKGSLPYDVGVLSQEAVVEGSKYLIFHRLLEWMGPDAFSAMETDVLIQDFWMLKPNFLLEAFDRCDTAKGIIVDETSDLYFYLLATERNQLRRELIQALKGIMLEAHVKAIA